MGFRGLVIVRLSIRIVRGSIGGSEEPIAKEFSAASLTHEGSVQERALLSLTSPVGCTG